jgi:hypothetical protein
MDFSEFTYSEKLALLAAYRQHWGIIKKPGRSGTSIYRANKRRSKNKAVAKRRARRKNKKGR